MKKKVTTPLLSPSCNKGRTQEDNIVVVVLFATKQGGKNDTTVIILFATKQGRKDDIVTIIFFFSNNAKKKTMQLMSSSSQ
jgi:hypothetical protein